MECLLQYLDDLDDLYGAARLLWEDLRQMIIIAVTACALLGVALAAMWLATLHPPIALATSTVLFVILLYRSVTAPALKSYA